MTRLNPRLISVIALGFLAILGTLLVLKATPEGLNLSDDSIAYVAGARSILAGDGYREAYLASNQPVTHFPPGFSLVLAFFGLFGLDPLRGARLVNALLFGLNAGLLGILVWRMTPSLMAGLVLAALFVTNSEMLQVHTAAMSEPLFISFSLFALWMFDIYFERPPARFGWQGSVKGRWWLVFCAVFTGMAYLTRYAGLALVAVFIAALFILYPFWRDRFGNTMIFLAGFLPFALAWTLRNKFVAENATNRTFAWHPITSENIEIGRRVFSEFLIPVETWRREMLKAGVVDWMIVIILGVVLAWTIFRSWKYISKPRQASVLERGGKESREVISFTTGLYIFAYLASIVASMMMFDAATKFKLRILSPVFVGLLILLVAFGIWMRNKQRVLVVIATITLLCFSIYKQSITVAQLSKGGLGYASFQWYDSEAMKYLRDLPDDIKIYTNEPAAVYLYTGRGAYVLPDRYDSATAQERPGFEEGVAKMHGEINDGKAVLAMFDNGGNVASNVKILTDNLYVAHKSQEDSIYTAVP
ncbi:MAG: phospholipid carrier-dependent glycosyltransferase [Anaerolineales bacterium]|nr:phospholipid carrier-dependent glycosyltransferase [Anaerolineales bacterium]